MDFTLSEEQRLATEMLRNMLAAECSMLRLRKMLDTGETRDPRRWSKLFELGLGGVLAPEEAGGLGLGELDFALAAEECGRALLPEPLVEHAGIAVPLLAQSPSPASPEASSPGLSRGPTSGRTTDPAGSMHRYDVGDRDKPGHDGRGAGDVLAAAMAGDMPIAVGHPLDPFVAEADAAEFLLLPRAGELHLVERSHVELTLQPSIDPFRRLFRVDWLPSSATLMADAERGQALWDAALDRGALFAAAQCLGIAQRAVEIAAAFAKERQQFGKPIGAYQATKHHLATVQVKLEFARPVVHAAAALFATGDRISEARISHAKLTACDAADLACRTAIQVHGAMGYSWEVDVHFFLKRALALAGAWGDRSFHRRRVAHRLFETGLPIGPDLTFATECRRHVA